MIAIRKYQHNYLYIIQDLLTSGSSLNMVRASFNTHLSLLFYKGDAIPEATSCPSHMTVTCSPDQDVQHMMLRNEFKHRCQTKR